MTQSDGTIVSVERSNVERDLGIMIDTDSGLKFSEQIYGIQKGKQYHGSHTKNFCMSRLTMFQCAI